MAIGNPSLSATFGSWIEDCGSRIEESYPRGNPKGGMRTPAQHRVRTRRSLVTTSEKPRAAHPRMAATKRRQSRSVRQFGGSTALPASCCGFTRHPASLAAVKVTRNDAACASIYQISEHRGLWPRMVDEASRDVPDLLQQACGLAPVEDSANDASAD